MDRNAQALESLKSSLQQGTFHHATMKEQGKLWDGLYIYENDPSGLRGFRWLCQIDLGSEQLQDALDSIPSMDWSSFEV